VQSLARLTMRLLSNLNRKENKQAKACTPKEIFWVGVRTPSAKLSPHSFIFIVYLESQREKIL